MRLRTAFFWLNYICGAHTQHRPDTLHLCRSNVPSSIHTRWHLIEINSFCDVTWTMDNLNISGCSDAWQTRTDRFSGVCIKLCRQNGTRSPMLTRVSARPQCKHWKFRRVSKWVRLLWIRLPDNTKQRRKATKKKSEKEIKQHFFSVDLFLLKSQAPFSRFDFVSRYFSSFVFVGSLDMQCSVRDFVYMSDSRCFFFFFYATSRWMHGAAVCNELRRKRQHCSRNSQFWTQCLYFARAMPNIRQSPVDWLNLFSGQSLSLTARVRVEGVKYKYVRRQSRIKSIIISLHIELSWLPFEPNAILLAHWYWTENSDGVLRSHFPIARSCVYLQRDKRFRRNCFSQEGSIWPCGDRNDCHVNLLAELFISMRSHAQIITYYFILLIDRCHFARHVQSDWIRCNRCGTGPKEIAHKTFSMKNVRAHNVRACFWLCGCRRHIRFEFRLFSTRVLKKFKSIEPEVIQSHLGECVFFYIEFRDSRLLNFTGTPSMQAITANVLDACNYRPTHN